MNITRKADGVFFKDQKILSISAATRFASFEPTARQKCDWAGFFKFDAAGSVYIGIVSSKGKLFIRKSEAGAQRLTQCSAAVMREIKKLKV